MIGEVNYLVNELDIKAKDAEEIINIYFDTYAGNNWDYQDYLKNEIRIIVNTPENQGTIAKLLTIDDRLILIQDDEYLIIANYSTAVKMGEIEDFLPNHS